MSLLQAPIKFLNNGLLK